MGEKGSFWDSNQENKAKRSYTQQNFIAKSVLFLARIGNQDVTW